MNCQINMNSNKICIAVGQLTSTSDKSRNLGVIQHLARKAALEHGAKVITIS